MRIFSSRSLILLVLLLLCACRQMDMADSTPDQSAPAQAVEVGMWGGNALGMDVVEEGASLEFDCARGTIDGRIPLDASGRFTVEGSYFQETGGPTNAIEHPPPVKARYEGSVSGDTLSMTVVNLETGEKIGAYSLTLGATARLMKCL